MRSEEPKHHAVSARTASVGGALGFRPSEARKAIAKWKQGAFLQTKEHPARTLAMAIGAGYLLGGGLFTRLTGRLVARTLRVGLGLAAGPLVTQGIAALTQGLPGHGDLGPVKPAPGVRRNGPRAAR